MEPKTMDQITRDVMDDWKRDKDQQTIRRRWPKLKTDAEIQTAEMRQRWWLQQRLMEVDQLKTRK